MLRVTINGQSHDVREGGTILAAIRSAGGDVPTLCHDERLAPSGACRLCAVSIEGSQRLATACNTPVGEGMVIETHSPEVEAERRTLLRLLAADYPADAVATTPDKPFHRLLHDYGITATGNTNAVRFTDAQHRYLHVDMSQCITCFRCVRICDELQGQFVWRVWDRGDRTRILPNGDGGLMESDCVSCGACADSCPTGAIEDRSILEHGEPEEWTRTTCPYCGTGCEMLVGTRDDRIVQIKPLLDAPVSKGHLCVKGRYAYGFTHSRDRVREPMIRRDGEWREVSWAEVTGYIAERLRDIIATHGPQSVGMLGSARGTNEENYIAQKFARVVLGTNNIDCCARVCHAPTAAAMKRMLGTGAATNSFDDIELASAFLICGCNPTEAHPIVGARIKQAVLSGAKLIVIDPRETELTRYADVHLALRPGTNVPLLNALAHVIVTENLVDPAMMRDRVSGEDEFVRFIREWTPERAAGICGVLAGDIRSAARIYAATPPAMAFHGLGVTEHIQGTDGVMALVNLALLTGNLGKPGCGVNPLRGQNNVQGSAHMGCEPGHLTGYIPIEQGRDLFTETWGTRLPTVPGLNLMEMVDAAQRRELKALWAIGYDIAFTNPDTIETNRALESVDLIIVQDLFLNELAWECGHVFLPAASSYEKDGTFMNSERRVQRVRRAVPAPGNARADWEIVCAVAQAMGANMGFSFASAEEVWNEIRTLWKAGAGMSYARLDKAGLQWPCPDESHPGTTILHTDSFAGSARAPLQCIGFEQSEEICGPDFPLLLTTGRSLYQFNAGTMTMRTPNRDLRRTDTLDVSPADAADLGFTDGERVLVTSRQGSIEMPLRIDEGMKAGQLFATFHAGETGLNRIVGEGRDHATMTPEYKVVAVRLERMPA